ncbi:MAG: hypothetical protein H0X72_00520 [Acidobacteria bacterium]|jgi:hypothetical protein|nr:hypothetical protein [Acidobacteriota bacterium]
MEITLNLPENVYRNFSKLAEKKHRRVEEIITDKLQDDFSADNADYEETVAGWTDEAVLALANLKLPQEQSDRMSFLLDRLQEGLITESEERELEVYTELSQIATLRKAYGIAEAVKRKLISLPADLK